jgi:hypothetical protein
LTVFGRPARSRGHCSLPVSEEQTAPVGTSNDTELEKLKKRLQFVMHCIDCFVSRKKNRSPTLLDFKSSIPDSCFVLAVRAVLLPSNARLAAEATAVGPSPRSKPRPPRHGRGGLDAPPVPPHRRRKAPHRTRRAPPMDPPVHPSSSPKEGASSYTQGPSNGSPSPSLLIAVEEEASTPWQRPLQSPTGKPKRI